LKRGATDFLPKHCEADRLLDAVERALNRDMLVKRAGRERHDARRRLGRLTQRERQVFQWLHCAAEWALVGMIFWIMESAR
jgi:two-component system response regulator TtrR